VPVPSAIDSIVYTDLAGRGEEGEKISSVSFQVRNDQSVTKFWKIQLISKGLHQVYDWETREWSEKMEVLNIPVNVKLGQDSVFLNEPHPLEVFSNRKMKSTMYPVCVYLNEYYYSFNSNDTLFVQLLHLDESYYKYLKQYYLYETAGYINIGQSAQKYPLYSNVTNGLGIFTGFSITRKEFKMTSDME
jgi:hypothetical protein